MVVEQIYDEMASDYDEKYTDPDSSYMIDEDAASEHYNLRITPGSVLSLGCGTGQDAAITKAQDFVGLDISWPMLLKAQEKFPDHRFLKHDCSQSIPIRAEIIVSIFGTPNYIGIPALIDQYVRSNARSAFFVFYNDDYVDGVVPEYQTYTTKQLKTGFALYNPIVEPLFEGSNYTVVSWCNA